MVAMLNFNKNINILNNHTLNVDFCPFVAFILLRLLKRKAALRLRGHLV